MDFYSRLCFDSEQNVSVAPYRDDVYCAGCLKRGVKQKLAGDAMARR